MCNRLCLMGAAALVCARAFAQGGPALIPMGDLPGGPFSSRALGLGNGVMVGESRDSSGSWAVLWTRDGGLRNLGTLAPTDQFSRTAACSIDGSVVVGSSGFTPSVFECRAFRWTAAGGMQPLPAPQEDLALAISADGQTIVGQAAAGGAPRAFRWTGAGGRILLGPMSGGDTAYSSADGVSGQGEVTVGYARDAAFNTHAVRWLSPTQATSLGHLNSLGFQDSRAYACSMDGSVIAGESTSPNGSQEAFLWTAAGGMVGLGDLPGGDFRSVALAVSPDGELVVGWSDAAGGPRAFLWSKSQGMQDLNTLVAAWPGASGWTLTRATGVLHGSPLYVAGAGVNPQGHPEGWLADAGGCYPDCNSDSVLNLADFGCFQTNWAFGKPYTDCNGDGQHSLADFGCFQTRFALGCP